MPGQARLKVYRIGPPLSLSEVLPILSTTGVEVVDERPYQLEGLERESYIYDFGLRYQQAMPDRARELFQDTVAAVWNGRNESDGFNALVLAAGLTWRQATVLRAYAKYMRQGGTPFAQDYIEGALRNNVEITRYLVQLFEARFDPGRRDRNGGDIPADSESRQAKCADLEERIVRALDAVSSLDHDRILRSYLTDIRATLRTSYFATDSDGQPLDRLSLKVDPSSIPELPEPRPKFEIFVYSPRVEGVHLRFGSVARGGLRWSDRRDDFRTEILGLVKAQMVKNTVIVPVGAKGGFFAKQLPDAERSGRVDGRGRRQLHDVHLRAPRRHRQPRRRSGRARGGPAARRRAARRRRPLPGGRRRQGHGDVQRHRQPDLGRLRLLAGRRVRLGRLGRLRPQGHGHHRQGSLGLGAPALPRDGRGLPERGLHRRRASATCRATSSATGCSARSTSASSPPSTTATSSSTRRPTRPRRTPSAGGSSTCPGRRGRTTTPRSSPRAAASSRAAPKSIPISARDARGARHRGQRMTPAGADEGDPARAGRPALERRHRHLRQGPDRDARARPGTRPTTRSVSTDASCGSSASVRAATSG